MACSEIDNVSYCVDSAFVVIRTALILIASSLARAIPTLTLYTQCTTTGTFGLMFVVYSVLLQISEPNIVTQ